jgi:glucan phosphoethanolaminetransferase (alkaline phosphatase superfamily)
VSFCGGDIIETMRTLLEILFVLLIAAVGSLVVGTVFWLTLVEGSGADAYRIGQFWLITLSGAVPTGFLWYAKRRHAPYRYLESLRWSLLALTLSLALFSVFNAFTGFIPISGDRSAHTLEDAFYSAALVFSFGF